ncbi:MAG: ribosome biogenesis GTPase Der [Patescibacteria group bacterium]|nr:ribosome biogenesis GTPase Der [Patescibacteria group bacterium]
MIKKLPKILILGRANVGKSTLFNRLIERPKAITSKIAGTTRDMNISPVYWQGYNFELIDTGGIETIVPSRRLKKLSPDLNVDFALDIIRKTQAALTEADLILFVVDLQEGLMPQDRELAQAVKKYKKPILLVANKADDVKMRERAADFYKLGLGDISFVSAKNGGGTGDLLDEIVNNLKKQKKVRKGKKYEFPKAIRVTIIGKPNVGKSSLLNSILGEERVIVSPIAFTTRESIDTDFIYKDQNYTLVDTAGIRKHAKEGGELEKASVGKAIANARNSDVCLLVIDISQPITVQDNRLTQLLLDEQVSIIMVANKWDLVEEKESKTADEYKRLINHFFPYLRWAPIVFTSAKTGKHVHDILDIAKEVYDGRHIKLNTNALGKFLKNAIKKQRPNSSRLFLHPYLTNFKQVRTNPPIFEVQVRKKDVLASSYLRYLENSLRAKFKIIGTPIKVNLKLGSDKTEPTKPRKFTSRGKKKIQKSTSLSTSSPSKTFSSY